MVTIFSRHQRSCFIGIGDFFCVGVEVQRMLESRCKIAEMAQRRGHVPQFDIGVGTTIAANRPNEIGNMRVGVLLAPVDVDVDQLVAFTK